MRRFYSERNNLRVNSSVKLPDTEAQHVRDTLRMQKGDQIILFNGEQEYVAELGLVTKDVVMANITAELETTTPSDFQISLFPALIKPSNFELVLQKATEIGVDLISPISTEYSQTRNDVVVRKFGRWEKIILEACKQSERTTIPELKTLQHLDSGLLTTLNLEYDLVIAFSLQRQGQGVKFEEIGQLLSNKLNYKNIALLVGPEGGFSQNEHELFETHNINLVEILSGRVLKAETATIAAVAIVCELLLQL